MGVSPHVENLNKRSSLLTRFKAFGKNPDDTQLSGG